MVYGNKPEDTTDIAAPCIVAQIAREWKFDPSRVGFHNLGSSEFQAIEGLPDGARVEARFPDLLDADPDSLTDEEREMAQFVQFVFAPGTRLDSQLERIKGWAAVVDAYVVPEPGLPASPM